MHPTAGQPALRPWAFVPCPSSCQQADRASQEGPSPCRKAPAHQPSAAKPVPEREQQPKQHIFNFKKPISTWPAYFFQIIGRKMVGFTVGFGKGFARFRRSSLRAQRGSTLCVNPTTRISRPTDDPPGGKLAKRPCALGGLGRPQRGTLSVPGAHPVIPELIGRIQATGTAVSSDGSRLAGHARGC